MFSFIVRYEEKVIPNFNMMSMCQQPKNLDFINVPFKSVHLEMNDSKRCMISKSKCNIIYRRWYRQNENNITTVAKQQIYTRWFRFTLRTRFTCNMYYYATIRCVSYPDYIQYRYSH